MITMKFKPKYLPQISMLYEEMLNALDTENIKYEIYDHTPSNNDGIKISQGIIFSNNVDNISGENMNPIWVSKDNDILDGHHKYYYCLVNGTSLKIIKVLLCFKDACRVLNKIQDIHDYSKQEKMEEIVGNDILNDMNDNQYIEDEDFLTMVEHHVEDSDDSKNPTKIVAYRKTPISNSSVIGNFFILEPAKGYKKYEIEFENLLETDQMGISYKDGQLPIEVLSKSWFPHVNFVTLGEKHGVDDVKIRNRAIVEKAKKMGYDGILYGNKLVQGF